MTRTASRHTLSALAAAVLVSVFAAGPASAWTEVPMPQIDEQVSKSKVKTHKGLATQNGSQEPSMNRQFTRMIVKKLDKVR